MPQRVALLLLAGELLVLPKLLNALRARRTLRAQTRLSRAKQQAEDKAMKRLAEQEREQQEILESALNSDLSITPGMLPPHIAQGLELLRCVVTENYLNLQHRRLTLGENSIDWQVELLKLAEKEYAKEFPTHVPLTRAQTVQAMNSYLTHLMNQTSLHSEAQVA